MSALRPASLRRVGNLLPTRLVRNKERWATSCPPYIFLVMLFVSLSSVPAFAAPVVEDPLERQMLDIAKDLRCAVCQNQPISESNADLARDMRDIIREQLKAGKSRDAIMQYFVDRYGNFVLLKPPVHGTGTLLWVAPALIAGMLVLAAFVYLRHRRREAPSPTPKMSKKDIERVRQARRQDES